MLTTNQLLEEGYSITNNISESVYILSDGTLWSGEFNYGIRGVEHREVESFSPYDRYDGNKFWNDVMVNMGLVMIIPETEQVLVSPKYQPTENQNVLIDKAINLGFDLIEFN